MYRWVDCGQYWELKAPQGSDIWLAGRKGRVTTSVSGSLAGKSIFKTPEEQGAIIAGVVEEHFTEEELARMNHGTDFEPLARKWYSEYSKQKIIHYLATTFPGVLLKSNQGFYHFR